MNIEEVVKNLKKCGLDHDRAYHVVEHADTNVLLYYLRTAGLCNTRMAKEQVLDTVNKYRAGLVKPVVKHEILGNTPEVVIIDEPVEIVEPLVEEPIEEPVEAIEEVPEPQEQPDPELPIPDPVLHEVDLYDVSDIPDYKDDPKMWCVGVNQLLEMGAVKYRLAEELQVSTQTMTKRLKKGA